MIHALMRLTVSMTDAKTLKAIVQIIRVAWIVIATISHVPIMVVVMINLVATHLLRLHLVQTMAHLANFVQTQRVEMKILAP